MTKEPTTQLPITRLLPNIATIFGLCAGLTSMRYALDERWDLSLTFILIAAFIDGIDGKLARMFNASSEFGAQLDSLTDFVCFGIAPPFILYLWQLHTIPKLGWGIALFFSICCMIRLARFNATLDEEQPEWQKRYFVGIPSPAGACLVLGPLFVTFALANDFPAIFATVDWFTDPVTLCIYTPLVALLMASRIPTISLKGLSISRRYASAFLVVIAIYLVALFTKPWLILVLTGLAYYALMPVIFWRFCRRSNGK